MKIVTLNVHDIEINAIQAVDTMTFTYKGLKRIQNDDDEVVRLTKFGADDATKNGINPYCEFEKKNRIKVRNRRRRGEEEENHGKIIKEVFITHYKCELNKALDRLISGITDICTYMKEVIMPVTILHPKNICSGTKADIEIFCSKSPTDLNDSDAFFCGIELV